MSAFAERVQEQAHAYAYARNSNTNSGVPVNLACAIYVSTGDRALTLQLAAA